MKQGRQERWERVVELFGEIRDLTPKQRDSYWERAAQADLPHRSEVEALIAQDAGIDNFLEPMWDLHTKTATSRFTDPLIGAVVSHYRILERLGAGGNGVVYKAEDARLQRLVALKFLRKEPASDPNALSRFQREAQALSALNHPNICTIYDVDERDGRPFIVMEYLKGATLRERLAQGPLPTDELLELAIQITEALDAAHSQGILHRDIKPANIFVAERLQGQQVRYQAKLLDFGLTKAFRKIETRTFTIGAPHDSNPQTHIGAILGTVEYMSPEQARGEELDARSDLFSLGIVLYQMATGRLPFGGATTAVIFDAILNRCPVAPSQLNSEIAAKLDAIINKLLEKQPALRYQAAADLDVDLRQLRGDAVAIPRVQDKPQKSRRVWTWASLTIMLAMAVVMILLYIRKPSAPLLTEREPILLADFTNTTGDPMFDDTLKQVLAVRLEESPYLNVLPDERVRQTLRLMGRSPDERVTDAGGREVCQRQSLKAMMTGSIAALGSQYVITLTAVNCLTGESIARVAEEASNKEAVLDALATAITTLRARLGESLPSIERFNGSYKQMTSSLEALKLRTQANQLREAGKSREAIPLLKRAIELDPNFAGAYVALALVYGDLRQPTLRQQSLSQAYELRNRLPELERLDVAARYHLEVSGDSEQAYDALTLFRQTYPARAAAYNLLASHYSQLGQFDRSAELHLEASRLNPNSFVFAVNLADSYIKLNRLHDAKTLLQEKPRANSPQAHGLLFQIAHYQQDETARIFELKWLSENDPVNAFAFQAAEATLAGKLQEASTLWLKSADTSIRSGLEEGGAQRILTLAETEAIFGLKAEVQKHVASALKVESGRDVTCPAARILTEAGFVNQARTLLDQCAQQYPATHTLGNAVVLPTIRAALDLIGGNATSSLDELQRAQPYYFQSDHSMYVRALAYVAAKQPANARTEFQKLLDRFQNSLSVYKPVSQLGVARALGQMGDINGSRKAYEQFLNAWKDADSDLPILIAAKREYSSLK